MRSHVVWSGLVLLGLAVFGCGGGSDNPGGPDDTVEYVHIQSVSPENGTYALGDSVTVSIVFDKPVVMVGAILVPSLRGLAVDSLNYQQWLIRSEDMTTFSRNITLEPNTAYQLLVVYALGADSSSGLDEGRIVSFSTTPEMPSGAIEGHIDTPASYDPVGSVLILVDAYHWVGWMGGQEMLDYIVALGWVSDEGGDYRIDHLAPGKYYLYALRNAVENGEINEEESLFGLYGDWGLGVQLLAIDVRNNQTTENIDFPMFQGRSFIQ